MAGLRPCEDILAGSHFPDLSSLPIPPHTVCKSTAVTHHTQSKSPRQCRAVYCSCANPAAWRLGPSGQSPTSFRPPAQHLLSITVRQQPNGQRAIHARFPPWLVSSSLCGDLDRLLVLSLLLSLHLTLWSGMAYIYRGVFCELELALSGTLCRSLPPAPWTLPDPRLTAAIHCHLI